MKPCLLSFFFHWILRFSWSSPKISRLHNRQKKEGQKQNFYMWLGDKNDSSSMDLLGKTWVILSPALLWSPSMALPQPSRPESTCVSPNTCWQQADRRESEESWRCLSLPFPEVLLEAIITLFSRWEISFSPSFSIVVTVFYTYLGFFYNFMSFYLGFTTTQNSQMST